MSTTSESGSGAGTSPVARQHRSRTWRDPRLVVGVSLVAVCGLLGGALVGRGDGTVAVWSTRVPLSEGAPVPADALVARQVRFADQADADRYLSATRPLPGERVLVRPVGAGELLPRAAVGSGQGVPDLEVPIAIPVESVPTTVRAGSLVDVWVTPPQQREGSGSGSGASRVLERVPVVELDSGQSLGAGTRRVVVGLDAAEADQLPRALSRLATGSVVLVRWAE